MVEGFGRPDFENVRRKEWEIVLGRAEVGIEIGSPGILLGPLLGRAIVRVAKIAKMVGRRARRRIMVYVYCQRGADWSKEGLRGKSALYQAVRTSRGGLKGYLLMESAFIR